MRLWTVTYKAHDDKMVLINPPRIEIATKSSEDASVAMKIALEHLSKKTPKQGIIEIKLTQTISAIGLESFE